jgi:fructose-bisphosphate aldolase class 1
MSAGIAKECRTCRHFLSVPVAVEDAVPGLASLSSGYASVRADDGLCALHDRYVAARSVCDCFSREDWRDVT